MINNDLKQPICVENKLLRDYCVANDATYKIGVRHGTGEIILMFYASGRGWGKDAFISTLPASNFTKDFTKDFSKDEEVTNVLQ